MYDQLDRDEAVLLYGDGSVFYGGSISSPPTTSVVIRHPPQFVRKNRQDRRKAKADDRKAAKARRQHVRSLNRQFGRLHR